MNIYSQFKVIISNIFLEILEDQSITLPMNKFTVELPRDRNFGDMSTNICLVLSKYVGKKPNELANLLKPKLEKLKDIKSVSIEGPGFINFNLNNSFWQMNLSLILSKKLLYGHTNIGKNQNINVEFVSANPTGPLHVGHVRGAVIGDSLANILSTVGYNVTREYYVNDAGNQIDILAKSVFLRYKEIISNKPIIMSEGLYPGEYLIPIAQKLVDEFKDELLSFNYDKYINIIKSKSIEIILNGIKQDLNDLNIKMDIYTSEKTLVTNLFVEKAINSLEKKDLVYFGILPPPKTNIDIDWEPKKQKLFRATKFGDDEDRTISKSDGSLTYFASDIAYHMDKLNRTNGSLINIWGADHGGYVKRMLSAVNAISGKEDQLDIKLCQMVNLIKNGKSIKMSKRSGSFITLKDILKEVGGDAIRFIMLTRRSDQTLEFDFNKVTEKSKDNPVFYVQYAHARASSVLRKAKELGLILTNANLNNIKLLNHELQINLCKFMVNWPKVLETSAINHEPHRVAFYLIELSSMFHSLWSKGRELNEVRFFQEGNEKLTYASLGLVLATKYIIESGLNILSVSAPEEM